MPPCSALYAATLALSLFPSLAAAEGFLVERRASLRSRVDARTFQGELQEAMGEALGCGGQVGSARLAALEEALAPMWRAMPKNAGGRVERRALRHLVHRYFSRRSALLVRGFEPSRPANASSWGDADILSQRVPAYVESVLESKHAQEHGFNLRDAAYMVATLEQLIFDSESALLEKVYHQQRKATDRSLGAEGLGQVLEDYMVHWLLGDDEAGIKACLADRTFLASNVPHWSEIAGFARGQVQALDYRRQQEPAALARPGRHALATRYSFEDAHDMVGGITRSFASFWDSECASMKDQLVKMDTHHTGRVPLSRFYSSALDTEWRFGESEAYLRELGALDETSSWHGKQVIIPNYLQAASNCIVSTPHYLVCCVNECEGLLGEVEAAVGAPSAPPSQILALVGNMTSQTTLEHDDPPQLAGALTAQLEQIAAAHGGAVPLHGRLFAQWLHYAFPRECPYPHKIGTAAAVTPSEFGDSFIASRDEMQRHAESADATDAVAGMGREELQWMSQWSSEEELIADYGSQMRAPWESSGIAAGGALLFLCGVVGTLGYSRRAGGSDAGLLPTHTKPHFV